MSAQAAEEFARRKKHLEEVRLAQARLQVPQCARVSHVRAAAAYLCEFARNVELACIKQRVWKLCKPGIYVDMCQYLLMSMYVGHSGVHVSMDAAI
jgi:hypothetical protein